MKYTVKEVWNAWRLVQESIVNAGMDMSDFSEREFPKMIEDFLSGEWGEDYEQTRQTTLDEFYEEE